MTSTDCSDLIGIDVGTTNTSAWFQDKKTKTIQKVTGDDGSHIFPSVVQYKHDGKIIVGKAAERAISRVEPGVIKSSKLLIGRQYSDEIVLKSLSSCCSPVVNRNGYPVFEIFKDQFVSPTEVATEIIKNILKQAERVQQSAFKRCVLTVPVYFAHAQRVETKKAAESAGLEVICVTEEPCAAAFAYAYTQPQNHFSGTIFVYDLGGGTFDSTVVKCDDNLFDPVNSLGNDGLGGDVVDKLIYNDVETQYIEKYGGENIFGKDNTSFRKVNALMRKCRIAKETIGNGACEAVIEVDEVDGADDFTYILSARLLTNLIQTLITDTRSTSMKTYEDAKISVSAVDRVMMVGGSTRLPAVSPMLEKLFGMEKMVDRKSFDPMTIVSKGAFLKGMKLISEGKTEPLVVRDSVGNEGDGECIQVLKPFYGVITDRLTMSIGVNCDDRDTGKTYLSIIIPKGSVLPFSNTMNYVTKPDSHQTTMSVLQGENIDDPLSNKRLGGMKVYDIPKGRVKHRVTMELDQNGILFVSNVFDYEEKIHIVVDREIFDTSESAVVNGQAKKKYDFGKPVRIESKEEYLRNLPKPRNEIKKDGSEKTTKRDDNGKKKPKKAQHSPMELDIPPFRGIPVACPQENCPPPLPTRPPPSASPSINPMPQAEVPPTVVIPPLTPSSLSHEMKESQTMSLETIDDTIVPEITDVIAEPEAEDSIQHEVVLRMRACKCVVY